MKEQRLTGEERQELVAYLDGETDPSLAEKLEAKIANSVSARTEVEVLRRTWELLDFLKNPEVSGKFTALTMEKISEEGQRQVARGRSAAQMGKEAVAVVAWVAGIVLCFVAGQFAVAAWPDPNRRLIENLPVLERYEGYRAIGSFSFLKSLNDDKILVGVDEPLSSDN